HHRSPHGRHRRGRHPRRRRPGLSPRVLRSPDRLGPGKGGLAGCGGPSSVVELFDPGDRKSTRLNSSHGSISYAVLCLKKKITSSTHATATDKEISREHDMSHMSVTTPAYGRYSINMTTTLGNNLYIDQVQTRTRANNA